MTPANANTNEDCAAPRLHHIGVLVKDIPAAAGDFVARLGYVLETEIIEDPVQTALVQFLRQPGATFWLELVAPNGPDSKLSRAIRKGGGVHHLCYVVDDIDALCSHLREHDMMMLAEPVPAEAFPERRIAWFMDQAGVLIEIVERGRGPLSLNAIAHPRAQTR